MKNLLDVISSLFFKPNAKIKMANNKNNDKEKSYQNIDVGQVLKLMFTKTDPMSLTEYPYHWEKDYFPPLSSEERKYMRGEILRWYQTYLDVFYSKLVSGVISFVLKPSSKNEWAINYHREFPEEFNLMIQDIVDRNIVKLIKDKIQQLSDWQIIKWKPIKGAESWQPPENEIRPILRDVANISITEAEEQYKKQREEIKKILQIQKSDIPPDVKKQNIIDSIKDYLVHNKKELIKHCYDRLTLEYNSFPYYYGRMEKPFKNDIYEKYRLQFGCTTYSELFAKVFVPLRKFIELHGKKEVKKWIEEQWDEFIIFMQHDYTSKTEEELYRIKPEEFNKYAFALDYYVVILFKISMDGM